MSTKTIKEKSQYLLKGSLILQILMFSLNITWGLEPGPGIKTVNTALYTNNYTKIYLDFNHINSGLFTNMASKSNPATIHGNAALVQGIFGKALQTDKDGTVTISCKEFSPKQTSFAAELLMRCGKENNETVILEVIDSSDATDWELRLTSSQDSSKLIWSITDPSAGEQYELFSNSGLRNPERWYRISLILGSPPGAGGSTALRIYLDGYLVAEKPYFGKIGMGHSSLLHIKSPTNGAIDELTLSARSHDIFHKVDTSPIPVYNLDFEAGNKGWLGVYDNCLLDNKIYHTGKQSLRIETDDAYTREYLSPIFSVQPGATYSVSFWAKVARWDTGYSPISLWCRWYFEPEETCSFGGDLVAHCIDNNTPRTFDWKEFSKELTVPADKSCRRPVRWARFQVKNYHSKTLAWIDDIKIKKIKTVKAR